MPTPSSQDLVYHPFDHSPSSQTIQWPALSIPENATVIEALLAAGTAHASQILFSDLQEIAARREELFKKNEEIRIKEAQKISLTPLEKRFAAAGPSLEVWIKHGARPSSFFPRGINPLEYALYYASMRTDRTLIELSLLAGFRPLPITVETRVIPHETDLLQFLLKNKALDKKDIEALYAETQSKIERAEFGIQEAVTTYGPSRDLLKEALR